MVISIHKAVILCAVLSAVLSAVFVNASQPSSTEDQNVRNAAVELSTSSSVASAFGGASVSELVKGNVQRDPAYLRTRHAGDFPVIPKSRNQRVKRRICPKGKKTPPCN
ncbi:hypothetical protein CKAH01_11464 [Colletotrichum kahawae]|uniref:Uncharacterized protein n=1 Tax=Colletotrichum kahawae TaxID=34407 RepID=A0AAD9YT99_COLKA|nr:hypothetical protein CKAH01_11464 [Colletotrichum kahawae]